MTSKPQRSLLSPTPRLDVPHRGSAASQAPSQHVTPAAGAASNTFNPAGQRTPHAPAVPCHRTDPGETADEAALGSDGDNNHLQGGNGVITQAGPVSHRCRWDLLWSGATLPSTRCAPPAGTGVTPTLGQHCSPSSPLCQRCQPGLRASVCPGPGRLSVVSHFIRMEIPGCINICPKASLGQPRIRGPRAVLQLNPSTCTDHMRSHPQSSLKPDQAAGPLALPVQTLLPLQEAHLGFGRSAGGCGV